MARVLLIDDDTTVLEMMRLALQAEGYTVEISLVPFENPRDIEQLQPDLICLDFKFRGRETIWNLLQKLKLYPPTSSIPLILCTAGLADVHEQEPLLREKGIPILYKPFSLDELLSLVHKCVTERPASS